MRELREIQTQISEEDVPDDVRKAMHSSENRIFSRYFDVFDNGQVYGIDRNTGRYFRRDQVAVIRRRLPQDELLAIAQKLHEFCQQHGVCLRSEEDEGIVMCGRSEFDDEDLFVQMRHGGESVSLDYV